MYSVYHFLRREALIVFYSLAFSSLVALLVILSYLEEYLFVIFTPYFSFIGANNVMVGSLQSLLTFQFLIVAYLVLASVLLSFFCVSFVLVIPLRVVSKASVLYLALLCLAPICIKSFFSSFFLIFSLVYRLLPSNYYAYFYLLDITAEGWVSTVFIFFGFFVVVLFFSAATAYYLYSSRKTTSLRTRVLPLFSTLFILSLFLPPDPFLHLLVLLLFLLFLEFVIFINSFVISYSAICLK